MAWGLYISVAMALPFLCAGQNPTYEGKSLSMSGFHLCTQNETRNGSVLVVHTITYKEEKPCGGWLMWMTCTVTLYKMIHQAEFREVTHRVTRCCDGYEQVGRYCALSVKRSDAFGAKPGCCPKADGFHPTSEDSGWDCEWDIDCPDWQKCCQTSSGFVCNDPESVANTGRYRFNATVTVKIDYLQLLIKNGSLLNHTRILQAMVAGALQTDLSVYYLASWPVHPHRTATSLLIDSSSALSLYHVKSKLPLLLKHIQEVTSVSVDDVNECAHASLRHCSPHAECTNTVGSYQCACSEGYLDADPINTGAECTAPTITGVQVANITGTSFCVYWSTQREEIQTFRITVKTGSDAVAAWDTNDTMVKVEELKPAVLYNVSLELSIHGNQVHTVQIVVKTDAQTLDATTRLTNIQFTDDLKDSSSVAFLNLSNSIKEEIYRAHELEALVNSGSLTIKIKNFSPGSVVVNFTIILIPTENQDITNTSKVLLISLTNSSKYTVDEDSTGVTDFDECASGDHDCSQTADCINSWASYTCVCQDGFTDINTQRPGRACQAALGTTTSHPTSSVFSRASNTISTLSITTRSSTAPTTTVGALTFSTVTTAALVSQTPTFTVPFSLSDAPTSVSTALTHSTTSYAFPSPTTLSSSTSPLSTVSSSTTPTSQSATSRTQFTEHTSPTTAPSTQSTATTIQSTSASAVPLIQSTTSMSTLTTPAGISSPVTPTTPSIASVTPSFSSFSPTTLPTASLSPATRIIYSSTATLIPTPAPTSIFTIHTTPSTTRINPSSVHLIQSTTTPSTAPTTPSTVPTTPSTAPTTPSTAPTTPSTAPTTPSTAPSTPSTALTTPSTIPSTPYTAPTTPSTAPSTPSTAPTTPSTAPTTPSTAPTTPSTAPTTPSTAPTTPSTAPTTPSTAPSTPSTALTTPSTAPSTPSTIPSTPSTAPTTPSTIPSTPSTVPTTPSTIPSTPSTAPTTQSTAPTTPSAASTTPSTAPTTPSTAPTTPSTAPTTPSTAPTTPSTVPTTPSTAPTTPSTAPTTPSTAPTTPSTAPTTPSTVPTTPSTVPTTPSTAPTTPSTVPTTPSTAPTTPATTMNATKCHASLLAAISVQCRVAAITVTIARDVLEQCRIMENSLYLGLEDCGVNGGNATHVQLTVAWNECATSLLHNDSMYTVTVRLLNNMEPYMSPSGTVEVARMHLQVPIMCTYMRSMLMSADFNSIGYDMIKDVISSSGSFHVKVQLLNGTVPLPSNHTLSSDDVVVVEVSMNTSAQQIKVVIHSCWATTSPNPADAIRFIFLDNRCPLNSYTKVLMNGNSSTSRVSVQIFSFVNAKMIYLHCQVQICVQMDSDTCVPDCVQRTARLSNTIGTAFGSSGPLLNSDEESSVEEKATLYVVGFSCLGVILTLIFVVSSVCLFYCQRNRIGHYNFNVKSKEEKFTYLVSNT